MAVPPDLPPGVSLRRSEPARGEQESIDKEPIELLNELRVALPGAQVLFAFLLAVPFRQRFHLATSLERTSYFATPSCALVATALAMATA